MPTTLNPVRAPAGLRTWYAARLQAAVAEMQTSLGYWILSAYRNAPPATMAQDASTSAIMRTAMRRLTRRWLRNFNSLAARAAPTLAERAQGHTDRQMLGELRRAGISVRFRATAAQNDALQAVIAEQVSLIRSLAQEHLTAVEGDVMRAVQQGRDLSTLTELVERRGGVARRRAELIARDQTAKATAVFARVRQQELGITEAIWMHSAGGKHPRASHVAYSGKRYKIADGVLLDGEVVWPGTAINCRCVSRPVVEGFV